MVTKRRVVILGGQGILINNAGIPGPTAPVQDVDPAQWENVYAVARTDQVGNRGLGNQEGAGQEEATSYIAYTGPFQVNEEKQHLTHSMFISLFPNWIGQTQPRVVRIEGDQLFLSTAAPISSSGQIVNSHLVWRRADVSIMASGR